MIESFRSQSNARHETPRFAEGGEFEGTGNRRFLGVGFPFWEGLEGAVSFCGSELDGFGGGHDVCARREESTAHGYGSAGHVKKFHNPADLKITKGTELGKGGFAKYISHATASSDSFDGLEWISESQGRKHGRTAKNFCGSAVSLPIGGWGQLSRRGSGGSDLGNSH